jgi:hypothetical protein
MMLQISRFSVDHVAEHQYEEEKRGLRSRAVSPRSKHESDQGRQSSQRAQRYRCQSGDSLSNIAAQASSGIGGSLR